MKTGNADNFWRATLGVALVAICTCGCESGSANSTDTPVTSPAPAGPSVTNQVDASEATAKVPLQPPALSPGVAEIVELAQKDVGGEVLIEYVRKSSVPFDLTADEILYLKDIGVADEVLAEMLRHGRQTSEQADTPQSVATPPAPTESAPASAPQQTTPTPQQSDLSQVPPAPPNPPSAPPQAAPVYTQPVTQVNNYYYSSLAPYGTWIELPSYGWVWQPACVAVTPGWQPYCNGGYWLYTDCGWYWHSTYSWGWAPFHYGRWHRHYNYGWVWVPGYEWSPAWVTWRYTDAYCGWAPLPPGCGWSAGIGLTWYGGRVGVRFSFGLGWDCFTFVSYHHFAGHPVHRHRVPTHQAQVVYNNSTVINNYVVGNNNTVINGGIPPSRVSAVTRSEIRKVQLHDVTSAPDGLQRAGRFESRNSRLAVYRPKAAPDATPPQTQPIRRTSVSRTTPAASLPTSTGFAENRSPSTGLSKPAPSSRSTLTTSPKPSAARTASTESAPVRRNGPAPESVARPGTATSPTGTSGRLAPGRASDGTPAPAAPPATSQPPVRKPASAEAGRVQGTQPSTQGRSAPATRTDPLRINSTAPSSGSRPNRTVTQPPPVQSTRPTRSAIPAPASPAPTTPIERPRSTPAPAPANPGDARPRSQAVPATTQPTAGSVRTPAASLSTAQVSAPPAALRQMPAQSYSLPPSVPSVTSRPRSFSMPASPSTPSIPQRSFAPPVTAPSYSAQRAASPPAVSVPSLPAQSRPSVSDPVPQGGSRGNAGGPGASSGSSGRRPR